MLYFITKMAKKDTSAPANLKVGQTVVAGESVEPAVGNAMPLKSIPLGTSVHNIELHPGKGGAMARSAGTYAKLVGKMANMLFCAYPQAKPVLSC